MNIKGALYIISFIILIAFAGVYQARLTQIISPIVLIFCSSFAAILFFSTICYSQHKFNFIKKYFSHQKNIILLNTANFMMWFFYVFSLKYLEPAIAVIIANSIGPLLVIIFSKYLRPGSQIFRLEKIASIGIILSLIFILYIILSGKSALQYTNTLELKIGIIFAIITGIGQVLFTIYSKKLSEASFSPSEILAWRYLVLFVISAFLLEKSQMMVVFTNEHSMMSILILSVFGMIVPVFLYQKAIKLTEPIFIAILMMLEPIFMFIGQIFDPRLRVSIFSYIGVALILLFSSMSVLGRYYGERRQP